MFGVLDRPDEWETAKLPDDWPVDAVNAAAEDHAWVDQADRLLNVRNGAAASGACLVEARLTLAKGHFEDWQPAKPAVVSGLLEQWPALARVLGAAPSSD
jgi:hypothetical protein